MTAFSRPYSSLLAIAALALVSCATTPVEESPSPAGISGFYESPFRLDEEDLVMQITLGDDGTFKLRLLSVYTGTAMTTIGTYAYDAGTDTAAFVDPNLFDGTEEIAFRDENRTMVLEPGDSEETVRLAKVDEFTQGIWDLPESPVPTETALFGTYEGDSAMRETMDYDSITLTLVPDGTFVIEMRSDGEQGALFLAGRFGYMPEKRLVVLWYEDFAYYADRFDFDPGERTLRGNAGSFNRSAAD